MKRRARPVLGVVVALVLFVPLAGASHGETRTQSSAASRASAGRVPVRVEAVVQGVPVPPTAAPTTSVPTIATVKGAVDRPTATTTAPSRPAPANGVDELGRTVDQLISGLAPPVTTTSTLRPATNVGVPAVAAAPTPTSTSATTPTSTPTPSSTTTTGAPCRNSTDPACGPFQFASQPGADNPMTVQVVTEPATPQAGQEMVFRITLTDPDGVSYGSSLFFLGNSGLGESSSDPCTRSGPWDPPARDPAHAVEVQSVRHTYFEAGSYTTSFAFDAGPFDCTDSVTGRGDRPYASSAKAMLTVVVTP